MNGLGWDTINAMTMLACDVFALIFLIALITRILSVKGGVPDRKVNTFVALSVIALAISSGGNAFFDNIAVGALGAFAGAVFSCIALCFLNASIGYGAQDKAASAFECESAPADGNEEEEAVQTREPNEGDDEERADSDAVEEASAGDEEEPAEPKGEDSANDAGQKRAERAEGTQAL